MTANFRRQRQSRPEEPPQVIHFSDEDGFEEEQKFEDLFTINGKAYQLWVNAPASVGLTYLKMVRTKGAESAAVWIMEQMIGEDGYEALMNYPKLKEKDVKRIMDIVKEYAMANEEDSAAGN